MLQIHVCGKNFDAFGDVFPKKYLPKDFGGENGNLKDICLDLEKDLIRHREHFKKSSQFGTDERLRFAKSHQTNDILGVGGSFRSIALD